MIAMRRSRLAQTLGLVLAVSLGTLGLALWRAVTLQPITPGPAADGAAIASAVPARRAVYPIEQVLAAVAKDPFHPERRAPAVAFRLPGEPAPAARPAPVETGASLQLVGTAVNPDGGGVAMCQWSGGSPRLVRVGEQIMGLTLARVRPGAAEFTTASGTTVVLRVQRAGS